MLGGLILSGRLPPLGNGLWGFVGRAGRSFG